MVVIAKKKEVRYEYSNDDFTDRMKRLFYEHRDYVYGVIIVFLATLLILTLCFTAFQINYFNSTIKNIRDELNQYIYNTYYYPDESIEGIDPIVLNNTLIDLNATTQHYKGWESWTFHDSGSGVPDGWNQTSGTQNQVQIIDTRFDHDKTLQISASRFGVDPTIDKWIGHASYGTVEYWYAQGRPGISLIMDQDFFRLKKQDGTTIIEVGNRWRRYSWYNDSVFVQDNSSYTGIWVWHNIRIDFRCEGALDYMNLTENSFNLWVDYNMIYPNATFNENATSLAIVEIETANAVANYDAIGISWENLEITGDPYQLGDKDDTWHGIQKTMDIYFYFAKNYKNIKNFTYSINFTTNMVINPYQDSYYGIYNHYINDYEMTIAPLIDNFTIPETTVVQSSIIYLNPSSEEVTHIKFILTTNQIAIDFDFNITADGYAYFWIP